MRRQKFNMSDVQRDGIEVFKRYGIQGAKNYHAHTKELTRDMNQREYEKFHSKLYAEKK